MPILGSGILAACLLLPSATPVQGLTGALLGTVKDTQGGVIPGVTVTAASPASIGGPVTATTDDRGVFRFPALPPGVYEIEAGPAGFQRYHEKDVPIGAGVTIERPIVLKPAGVVESVSVEASGTDIDARNPGIATRFTEEDLRTIPTRRASMFDALRSTPGINPTSPSSGTVTTFSAFGSGVNENMFLIDGTNFTCPCVGVSRSEPGVDFTQEIHVQSVGASAEFGNIQGAVVNVVMRQGSDRYQGDTAFFWQSADLTSRPVRLPIPNSTSDSGYERSRYNDVSASLGGPAVRGRAWFFAGYQRLRDSDSQPGTDPAYPRRYEQNKAFAKVTWRPARGWQVFHSIHNEQWVNPEQPTIARPFDATRRVSASVPAVTFGHLTHTLSSNTVWDVRVGRFVFEEESRPSTGSLTTPGRTDSVTRLASDAPQTFGDLRIFRTSAKATLSHYRPRLLGADHDWKIGFQVEDGGHAVTTIIPTGTRYVDSNGAPSQAISRAPARIGGLALTLSAFASDAITIKDWLTVNAGLRFDHSRASSQDLEAVDLEGRKTGEIVHGLGLMYRWNVLSPRLGVTARLTADGRTILRGSYGRFSQGVLTGELDPFHPGATPTVTTELATGTVRVEDPRAIIGFDRGVRAPHTDEYSIGVDRELARTFSAAIAYVRKRGSDFIGWSDVAGAYRPGTRLLANGQSVPVLALDVTVTTPADRRFLLSNQDDYGMTYNGLVLAAQKRRMHGWQAAGSYTLSRVSGLQPSSGTSAAGGQLSTLGPGGTFGRDPNDLTNARGRLANDRPHVFRLMGTVDVPGTGLSFAANLQHFSGKPWAASTVVNLPQNSQQRVQLEPRGSRRLPSQTLLDLRLSRPIRNGRVGIDLLLDVLNALNESAGEALSTETLATPTQQSVTGFGQPSVFVDPRRAMLGVRVRFGQ